MTMLKPCKEIDFPKKKKFFFKKKMIKKKIILLMLKDDVTFKGVVAWFENTT